MSRIQFPPADRNSDRFLRCQEATEDAFAGVAASAVAAGWHPEVSAALVELADHEDVVLARADGKHG
jgi:hypothetical protein